MKFGGLVKVRGEDTSGPATRKADANERMYIELQTRLDNLETVFKDFQAIQSEIEFLDESQQTLLEREQFENSYYDTIARAKGHILDHEAKLKGENVESRPRENAHHVSNVKLPSMTLPEFKGEYHKWLQFHDTFMALIDKNKNLSDIEKFYYLRGCLKGEAEHVLQALEASGENYKIAWDLLKERFENKRLIIDKHIQALFDITPISKESHISLRNLIDNYQKHLRALKQLGEPTDSWDRLIIHLLDSKLDPATKREWQQTSIAKGRILPSIADFTNFLTNHCQLLERVNAGNNANSQQKSNQRFSDKNRHDGKTFSHASTSNPVCPFCKNSHYIYHCKDFQALPVKSRLDEIKKLKLCLNCFRENHFAQECKSSGCKKCKRRHNTLLHFENCNKTSVNNNSIQNQTSEQNVSANVPSHALQPSVTTHSINLKNEIQVLLSTAVVQIKDSFGNFHNCRVLLDSGSQSNFFKINLPVIGINEASTNVSAIVRATIKSRHNAFQTELCFFILPKITEHVPNFSFDALELKIPGNLKLADPSFNVRGEIDALLGAGIFWDLLCIGQIKLGPRQPILQKSKFGWVLSGPINIAPAQTKQISCNFCANNELESQLERFWKLEDVPEAAKYSREELECEKEFLETYSHDETGRFVVRLPIRENVMQLGNSYDNALKRFHTLERKLSRNLELQRQYVDFMQEYENSSITLCWIASQPNTWQVFVSNRVSQIQQLTDISSWRHVPSEFNPADILSRGVEPHQLKDSKLWWNGPEWLSQGIETWPKWHPKDTTEIPERRKCQISLFNKISNQFMNFERYSILYKLQRIFAYCLRFVENIKTPKEQRIHGKLTIEELKRSQSMLIKIVQAETFSQEIHDLEKNRMVNRGSKLSSLNPFLDESKIIRVGGRIGKSSLEYDRKYPIVLPEKHHFTRLIIRAEHHRQLHTGAQAVLASLRLNYWVLNGRNAIRSTFKAGGMFCERYTSTLRLLDTTGGGVIETASKEISGPRVASVANNKKKVTEARNIKCLLVRGCIS
ncbi:hypothetical protein NQ318_014790 [Aromia moschata]|uniref:Peptidase aspartic putative domain-containing protein n=1 Tax=Aromia moschata TaxID=1265417 RepID=A0AAV8ZDX6_9CUCU|nr:hypothetical protein NQ318_014790 [Aromia moschata]